MVGTLARERPRRRPAATPQDDTALKPVLKWAGGKRWQVPYLRQRWEPHQQRRLVEPFCGGLAVALGLSPRRALLNDANPHLISFYEWVGRGLTIDLPLENDEKMFYDYRERFNALVTSGEADSNEAAMLFYYLNRTGYNGLCRFNRRGRFNVPFGRYRAINYQREFSAHARVFARWSFTSVDAVSLALEANDFVYADPPYDVPFTQYGKDAFGWSEQVRTAEFLADHPGPVILTNQATDRIVSLYGDLGYDLDFLDAPRMISCTGERRPAREVVATRHL